MSYNKGEKFRSLIPFIEGQLPSVLKEDQDSELLNFIREYYRFTEQNTNVQDRIYALPEIVDLDSGIPEFYEQFRRETHPIIPNSAVLDKKILSKIIPETYRNKGIEQSIKFLFRATYNDEPEIFYPNDRLLLANQNFFGSGDTILRVKYDLNRDPFGFVGRTIYGANAQALVVSIAQTSYGSIPFVELVVTDIIGVFQVNELVETRDPPVEISGLDYYAGETYGLLSNFTLLNPAQIYRSDQTFWVQGAIDGNGFSARISTILGSVGEINIEHAGYGYSTPPTITIVGDGSGATATAQIDAEGRVIGITITDGGSGYTEAEVQFSVGGSPWEQAKARIVLFGELRDLSIVDPGVGYNTQPFYNPVISSDLTIDPNIRLIPSALGEFRSRVQRFDPETDEIPNQNYHVVINVANGSGSFVPGEIVEQPNGFQGVVVRFEELDRRLIIERTFEGGIVVRDPIVGATSGAEWIVDPSVSKPYRIDAGDNEIDREYTYEVSSSISARLWGPLLKKTYHPAGLRFVGIVLINVDGDNGEGVETADARMYHYFIPETNAGDETVTPENSGPNYFFNNRIDLNTFEYQRKFLEYVRAYDLDLNRDVRADLQNETFEIDYDTMVEYKFYYDTFIFDLSESLVYQVVVQNPNESLASLSRKFFRSILILEADLESYVKLNDFKSYETRKITFDLDIESLAGEITNDILIQIEPVYRYKEFYDSIIRNYSTTPVGLIVNFGQDYSLIDLGYKTFRVGENDVSVSRIIDVGNLTLESVEVGSELDADISGLRTSEYEIDQTRGVFSNPPSLSYKDFYNMPFNDMEEALVANILDQTEFDEDATAFSAKFMRSTTDFQVFTLPP